MDHKKEWINQKKNLATIFLGLGLVGFIKGIILELLKVNQGFDPRIISGLGILFIGIGLSNWIRCRSAVKDSVTTRREINAERDERMVTIRTRAGNRAFWVSILMTYTCLMWESFAGNGSLPKLTSDGLWFFLAAAVIIPFAVYIASILYDQKNY
jgi:hypothetical protein